MHIAPCTNVGELVLAVLQYCVCSLEGVGLFVQGLQVSLVHPLSMCPSFCHFISTQLRCVSKCARPHSRSKPVASLFVGGLQSNSKCVHPLQQTTHMFQACSAKIVSRVKGFIVTHYDMQKEIPKSRTATGPPKGPVSKVSPTMHCVLRPVPCGAQTMRRLCCPLSG